MKLILLPSPRVTVGLCNGGSACALAVVGLQGSSARVSGEMDLGRCAAGFVGSNNLLVSAGCVGRWLVKERPFLHAGLPPAPCQSVSKLSGSLVLLGRFNGFQQLYERVLPRITFLPPPL